MKEVGKLLKHRRMSKGLSIQEISSILKISNPILKAIEEGETNRLPAKVFLRGFVQSYATYLKMNLEEVMDLFSKDTATDTDSDTDMDTDSGAGATGTNAGRGTRWNTNTNMALKESKLSSTEQIITNSQPLCHPLQDKKNQKLFSTREFSLGEKRLFSTSSSKIKFILVLSFAVLVSAIILTKKTLRRSSQENSKDASTQALSSNLHKLSEFQQLKRTAEEDKKKVQPSSQKTSSKTKKTKASQPSSVAAVSESATNATRLTRSPQKEPQRVVLEAFNNLRIHYKLDESSSQELSLLPGQKKTFKAKTSITLKLSDGGAVSIVHNGKRQGVPGAMGTPITLQYPPASLGAKKDSPNHSSGSNGSNTNPASNSSSTSPSDSL